MSTVKNVMNVGDVLILSEEGITAEFAGRYSVVDAAVKKCQEEQWALMVRTVFNILCS